MGAAHTVAAIDKGTERLRTTARSTTEIDSDLKCIMEEGRTRRPRPNPEENETSCDLRGVCATRKELDQVAKERTTHVLCLPSSFECLQKDLAFSLEGIGSQTQTVLNRR